MLLRLGLAICLMATTSAYAQSAPQYKQSPALDAQVQSGALPPVADRLPAHPLIYKTGSEVPTDNLTVTTGTYGGTLRLAFIGPSSSDYGFGSNELPLQQVGLGSTAEAPMANIFESYDVSPDATQFTFHLRQGLKWSDGVPVTAEDIRFWWENIENNKALTAAVPAMWTAGGEPMKLEVIDDFTVKCTFKQPYISFLFELANRWRPDMENMVLPAHYLKQFHIDYADKADLAKKIAAAGFGPDEWAKYFHTFGWGPNGPTEVTTGQLNVPTLRPWVVSEHPSLNVWIATRNPYYFKVDTSGQQLPYADSVRLEQVSDTQLIVVKAVSGDVDLVRESVSTSDVPLLKENEQKGNISVKLLDSHDPIMFSLNFSYQDDPELAKLFNTADFRRALNMAIGRDEILESAYLGLAKPSYTVPSEFDPDKANQMLDALGLDKKDSAGFRLLPSGKRLTIDIDYAALATDFTQVMDILRENWAAIGVELNAKVVSVPLWRQARDANKGEGYLLWADIPVSRGNPAMWQTLVGSQTYRFGPQYGLWYNSNGAQGRAPEGDVAQIFTLARKMREAGSLNDLDQAWKDTLTVLHDDVPWFIPLDDVVLPLVVSAKLGNVPDTGYQIVGNFGMEAYYFKK
ncbi:MAG TPA: ABC transporter substrate-binding protein [Devosiaceae bacterium]|jgi:peptide/nickel transport system substrate-binding protein